MLKLIVSIAELLATANRNPESLPQPIEIVDNLLYLDGKPITVDDRLQEWYDGHMYRIERVPSYGRFCKVNRRIARLPKQTNSPLIHQWRQNWWNGRQAATICDYLQDGLTNQEFIIKAVEINYVWVVLCVSQFGGHNIVIRDLHDLHDFLHGEVVEPEAPQDDTYAGQFICVHVDGRVSMPADMDTILHNLHCEYPDMTHGHAGDLSDGGNRTQVWASQSESINDDGKRAIAEIVPA